MPEILYESYGAEAILSSIDSAMEGIATVGEVIRGEGAAIVYEATETWMESNGQGTWAPLAGATIKKRVTLQKRGEFHASDLQRPLFVTGNLFHSAIGPAGPYSRVTEIDDGVVLGIEWEKSGYNIAEVLSVGTSSSGPGGATTIPGRPIWPTWDSYMGAAIRKEIGSLLAEHIAAHIRLAPTRAYAINKAGRPYDPTTGRFVRIT